MIRLHRPAIPQVLAERAQRETDRLWDAWRDGRPITIKSSLYAHSTVKQALKEAQHRKCAYCETVNPRSHDVVEHYRPKMGWRQQRTQELREPEYFWLAYAWGNLLFACDMCNDAGHKQNLFPLSNPGQRATAANPDTNQERPLLINPYHTDPSTHIEWHRDVPRPRRGSRRGRTTIEVFGLDRDQELIDARRDYLQMVSLILTAVEELPQASPNRAAIRNTLLEKLGEAAPYTAMIRANFATRIQAL